MNIRHHLIPTFMKDSFTLPSEFITTPTITIKGNKQITIENEYILQTFSSQQIILRYHEGNIEINGKQLIITAMYPEEIMLQGEINHITFHAKQ